MFNHWREIFAFRIQNRPAFMAVLTIVAVTLITSSATTCVAQQTASPSINSTVPKASLEAGRPGQDAYRPKEKSWCGIVDEALGEARALKPAMQAFVLQRIADGLSKCAPEKVLSVLVESFNSTLAISDDQPAVKKELQWSALEKVLSIRESVLEPLLPQAESDVQVRLRRNLISKAVSNRDFEKANVLLHQLPVDADYPYDSAAQIMLGLPPEQIGPREALFSEASKSYPDSHKRCTECDGFPALIQSCWRQLRPSEVIDAIEMVIEEADTSQPVDTGGKYFKNEYEYRVAELLPILRQLSPDRADRTLTSSVVGANTSPTNTAVTRSTLSDGGETGSSFNDVQHPPQNAPVNATPVDNIENHIGRISDMVQTDPDLAIAEARDLPLSSPYKRPGFNSSGLLAPRAHALVAIARNTVKSDPAASQEALEYLADSFEQGDPDIQSDYCIEGIKIATRLGVTTLHHELLERGLEQVSRLIARDIDAENPNTTLKAWWPSATTASRLLAVVSDESPVLALASAGRVADPDLALLARIRVANRKLGVRETVTTKVKKKTSQENWTMSMQLD